MQLVQSICDLLCIDHSFVIMTLADTADHLYSLLDQPCSQATLGEGISLWGLGMGL